MNASRSFADHERRVVITGMGIVAANGQDLDTFWRTIVQGISGAAILTRFDPRDIPSKVAAQLKNFDVTKFIDAKSARRFDLTLQYGIAAARMAVEDAKIDLAQMNPTASASSKPHRSATTKQPTGAKLPSSSAATAVCRSPR
jgi:3-oxoacyl-(acyl-carrier-protein) synthase